MTIKVAAVGAGHMGSAIVRGLQNQPDVHLRVFDDDALKPAPHVAHVKETSRFLMTPEKNEIVILAIPPQAFESSVLVVRPLSSVFMKTICNFGKNIGFSRATANTMANQMHGPMFSALPTFGR